MSGVTVWVGGGTGSGKTTVTRMLAGRHGLPVFPLDAFWYSHEARLPEPERSPDDQWLGQTPAAQAAEFEALARRIWYRLVTRPCFSLPRHGSSARSWSAARCHPPRMPGRHWPTGSRRTGSTASAWSASPRRAALRRYRSTAPGRCPGGAPLGETARCCDVVSLSLSGYGAAGLVRAPGH